MFFTLMLLFWYCNIYSFTCKNEEKSIFPQTLPEFSKTRVLHGTEIFLYNTEIESRGILFLNRTHIGKHMGHG